MFAVEVGEALAQTDVIRNVDMRPHWYVAYTLPRHERSVADRLKGEDVETYLPVYSLVRTWNRRRVEVELPLFPGYVFVENDHHQQSAGSLASRGNSLSGL